jgi:toxin FitB
MNIVDSSGWLEHFADGPNAAFFEPALENTAEILVPTISIYEVFERILHQAGEEAALQAVAVMGQGVVIDLDTTIALNAAKISHELKIPMADSIMLASARFHDATFWTQDADFATIEDVQYIPKT